MRVRRFVLGVVVLLVLVLAAVAYLQVRRGFSAREQPGAFEAYVASRMRRLALPNAAASTSNPVSLTASALQEGREHFADHCALCHANDGSGNTEVGRNLYPKPPDLRSTFTQDLKDGELFYIIRNGVRLSGMPAWGGIHSDAENWNLVHFIRHLPKITPDEIRAMEGMNPKGTDERSDEEHGGDTGAHPRTHDSTPKKQ